MLLMAWSSVQRTASTFIDIYQMTGLSKPRVARTDVIGKSGPVTHLINQQRRSSTKNRRSVRLPGHHQDRDGNRQRTAILASAHIGTARQRMAILLCA
jgi:hypothetical protein